MCELGPSQIRELVGSVRYWHHVLRFPHGITSPGAYDPRGVFASLQLPDLRGKRVLDVGTRDGFFAFACERLGAEVVAVDYADINLTGFGASRKIYGSRVEYVQANVYDLDPGRLGTFDVVLFLGVLYHLRHPLLALDRLRPLCRELLIVESLVCDSRVFTGFETGEPLAALAPRLTGIPMAQFLPVQRFHGDATNKWVPNVACLRALIEDAQFAPGPAHAWGDRALVHARPVADSPALRWVELDRGLRIPGS
jgi:tRNA (mo5U34)-methyltransferase